MDYITIDVSKVPENKVRPGKMVELIGSHHGIDALAEEAGTIAYEILTGLGACHTRVYRNGRI
jgi:alanine racemase